MRKEFIRLKTSHERKTWRKHAAVESTSFPHNVVDNTIELLSSLHAYFPRIDETFI